jgi:hypothetical protein
VFAERYWRVSEIAEAALCVRVPVPVILVGFFNIVLTRGTGEEALTPNATYADAAEFLEYMISYTLEDAKSQPVGAA